MIDIVIPNNNEKEFISLAEKLDLSGLIFLYDKIKNVSDLQKNTKLKIKSGVLCNYKDINKYKNKCLTVVCADEDPSTTRNIIEQYKPHIIINFEWQKRIDFVHHRASGMNHIMGKLMHEKKVCMGVNFNSLLEFGRWKKQVIIGRMKQNLMFSKKFGFGVCIASFAKEPYQLRSVQELKSVLEIIGVEGTRIKKIIKWNEEFVSKFYDKVK